MATRKSDPEPAEVETPQEPKEPPKVTADKIVLLDANDQPVKTVDNPVKDDRGESVLSLRVRAEDALYERAGTDENGLATYRPS